MITFDGDRSKKRKWFANKQLAIIKDLDVPATAKKWDGFTFRVWQQEDLDGGRITAPMGAVVLCSSPAGIKISVADYWAGGFGTYSDLHVVYTDSPGDAVSLTSYNLVSIEDMTATGVEIVKFRPEVTASPFGLIDGQTPGPATVYVQDYSALPGVMPYEGAEGFWLSSTAKFYIDFNGNGTQDFPKWITDSTLTFYCSDGSNLGGRRTATLQIGGRNVFAGAVQPQRIYQQLNKDWQVMHQRVNYERNGVGMLRGWNCIFPDFLPLYMSTAIPNDPLIIPGELRGILLDNTVWQNMWPLGSYSFLHGTDQVFLQVSDVTNTIQWGGATPAEQYFIDNPLEINWKIFFTLTVGNNSYIVNSSQFIDLLDTAQGGDILSGASPDWELARRMIEQFLPYPNNAFTVPYDSVMFHSHGGNIYTWTRAYGSVMFSTTGLYAAAIAVPAEVSAETGVRPDITYAGTFDTEPLYLCICNKVKEEVKAIYYGSPFGIWDILPGVEAGQTLVHARPVKVTPDEIFLIGVIKQDVDVEGVPTTKYFFASLNWQVIEGIASTDLWQKMGMLPFTVEEFNNFQVGLYGVDSRVNDLASYLSPPPVLPQMAVGPYAKYAIGMP
jgi:hypothetical protein